MKDGQGLRLRLEVLELDAEREGEPVKNVWPHCQKCGRFISSKTVRANRGYWDVDDDPTGWCSTCGNCNVSWEPT